MSFKTGSYFSTDAIKLAIYNIRQNDGNEIVMVGKPDDSGIVFEIRRVAMGDEASVPAVIKAAAPGEILIHNHPSGNVRPSAADLEIAARAAEKGVGSYIVDNNMTVIFPIVERIEVDDKEVENVSKEDIIDVLGAKGRLEVNFAGFEFREPQIEMALKCAESINSETILTAEAGTGTGKSFAYLVPIILYVSKNRGKKAVVSTSTIALEEQLYDRDIPFLLDKLGIENISVCVLKGRSNYLCKRKYSFFRIENLQVTLDSDNEEKAKTVAEIDSWINEVNDGTKTTMNHAVADNIWSEICAEELTCEKSKCRHFSKCYFFRARRKANFSSLILVNHHLLMADVSMKMEDEESGGILPKYNILVVDEAHNLFKSAMSFLGESASTQNITKQLKRLFTPRRGTGLLTRLLDNYSDIEINSSVEVAANGITRFLPLLTNSLKTELIEALGEKKEDIYELDDIETRKKLSGIVQNIVKPLKEILNPLGPVIKKLEIEDSEAAGLKTAKEELILSLKTDISGAVKKLKTYCDFLGDFCNNQDTDKFVFWGNRNKFDTISLSVTPLEIQKILAENIFDKTSSVILTSATLSTSKNTDGFNFFNRESGLNLTERKKEFLNLSSCFDYTKQVRAFVSTDLPSPVYGNEEFEDMSIDASKKIVKASNGGALVLFTSIKHRQLAKEAFTGLDFNVICQGQYAISSVVRKFRNDKNATLLATDTFWEGIDMKGETLRNLVLIKLPFKFPSHPFVKRYVAKLESESGKSGFMLYTLPNAILKFKQGFGRLIRTKTDTGSITILDKRIIEKRYGKDFLDAAPSGVTFQMLPSQKIAEKIKEFHQDNS